MHRIVILVVVAFAAQRVAADPFVGPLTQSLIATSAPPARFANHKPAFTVVDNEPHTFQDRSGPYTWNFTVIKDGARTVAIIPKEGYHGGTIYLLSNDPAKAPETPRFPTERWHLDTAIGSAVRTDMFIPSQGNLRWNGHTQETSVCQVAGDGASVVITREFKGALALKSGEAKGTYKRLEHKGTFVLRLDPVFGYVVDCTWATAAEPPPSAPLTYISLLPSGVMNPWPGRAPGHFGVFSPAEAGDDFKPGDVAGFALHSRGADRGRIAGSSFHKGGFAAFANTNSGAFSPALTIPFDAALRIVNTHAYFNFAIAWPTNAVKRPDGMTFFEVRARHLWFPPETTALVCKDVKFLNPMHYPIVYFPIGQKEDEGFENQPFPINSFTRGLAFPWGPDPEISKTVAHEGQKSLVVRGEVWPQIPQLPLPPGRRLRCAAWMKVEPATADQAKQQETQWRDAEAKRRAEFEKAAEAARKAGGTTNVAVTAFEERPFPGVEAGEGFIVGRLFEWTPWKGEWLANATTDRVKAGSGWKQVSFEIDSPAWGPYLDLRFFSTLGSAAYIDEFSFRDIGPASTDGR